MVSQSIFVYISLVKQKTKDSITSHMWFIIGRNKCMYPRVDETATIIRAERERWTEEENIS